MKRILILLFLNTSSLFASTQPSDIMQENLKKSQFTCTKVNETSSIKCIGMMSSYPKRIAVFFSENLTSLDQLQLHFHGWLLRFQAGELTSAQNYIADLNTLPYAQHLNKHQNTVLIVPESANKESTFVNSFGTATFFEKFISQIFTIIANTDHFIPKLGIEISGHSGAYKPLGIIAQHSINNLNSLYLSLIQKFSYYDASYDSPISGIYSKAVFNWLKISTNHFFEINYVSKSTTQAGALEFKNLVLSQNLFNQFKFNPYSGQEHETAYYKKLPAKYRMNHFYLLWDRF